MNEDKKSKAKKQRGRWCTVCKMFNRKDCDVCINCEGVGGFKHENC